MPPKNFNSGRFDMRFPVEWLPLMDQAAKADGRSLANYIRQAVRERMARDGYALPGVEIPPRGRPKKRKPA